MKVVSILVTLGLLTWPGIAMAEERVPLTEVSGLANYIDHLTELVEQNNTAAIRDHVATEFFVERDFGGSFMEGAPGWWNFAFVYPFASRIVNPDEDWVKEIEAARPMYHPDQDLALYLQGLRESLGVGASFWDPEYIEVSRLKFLADLPRFFVEKRSGQQGDVYCGEAYPSPRDWIAGADPSMSGLEAYVEAEGLNRRQAPSRQSPVIGRHEIEDIVEIASDYPVEDPKGDYRWVKVEAYWTEDSFAPGYVAARHLSLLQNPQICFSKTARAGEWG
ncbi:hypothetical protein V5T82_18120, partial [Magnetovibrio sp. PR-2]|uniref:hypothetical protein n=1 Tax=Magnetovibrio sp. PR-2 TaxID=3120356 RepID=UPI002FCDE5C8